MCSVYLVFLIGFAAGVYYTENMWYACGIGVGAVIAMVLIQITYYVWWKK
jgi:hypothetical protein